MPKSITPVELYKDSYLTKEDYLALYKGKPYPGLEDKDEVFSYVFKTILDKDLVSFFKKQVKNGLSIEYEFGGVFHNLTYAATVCQSKKVLTELIRLGANLDIGYTADNGVMRTPLHMAAQNNVDIVDILLKGGATVNLPNSECVFRAALRNIPALRYLLENTEGPNLGSVENKEITSTFTFLFLVKKMPDLLKIMLEGFMRRPAEEAKVLFKTVQSQIEYLDTYKDKYNTGLLNSIRDQGKQIFYECQTKFEKQLLDQSISVSEPGRLDTPTKIHKI